MTLNKKETIEKFYNFHPELKELEKLEKWEKLFIEYNSHTNLMSKNDTNVLFEKHVLDSLSITLISDFHRAKTVLDVGTGGGFPSIILALFFPSIKIIGIDSTGKKIKFLEYVKQELELDNFIPLLSRVENYPPLNVDIITNRAVGKIDEVWSFAKKHLKKGGYFVSYKSLTSKEEATIAKNKFKELKHLEFIPYVLPLDDNYTRELVVFKV